MLDEYLLFDIKLCRTVQNPRNGRYKHSDTRLRYSVAAYAMDISDVDLPTKRTIFFSKLTVYVVVMRAFACLWVSYAYKLGTEEIYVPS